MHTTMRLIVAFVLFFVFVSAGSLLAQKAAQAMPAANMPTTKKLIPKSLLNPISIDLNKVTLREALATISANGKFQLAYSSRKIPVHCKVSVKLQNAPAVVALTNVLEQTGTYFSVSKGGQVLIVPLPKLPNIEPPPSTGSISGMVIDERTQEPLPGANVFLKGTTIGAASALNGSFTIKNVPPGNYVVVVSYVGFLSQESEVQVVVDKVATVKFMMVADVFRGEEVVVTGIASRTSKAVAEVAVSRVAAAEYTNVQSYTGLGQLLNGKIAGVNVSTAAGVVGTGLRFDVRSGGGLNGNGQPIIYLDGVRLDNSEYQSRAQLAQPLSTLADLNLDDIEKIEMLKGPAGAASYGTSGADGVILITTKRGLQTADAQGKPFTINFKSVLGWNMAYNFSEKDDLIPNVVEAAKRHFRNGLIRKNTLSVAGRTGVINYYMSLDNYKEDGYHPLNWMDKNTVRANFDLFPSDKLNFRVSTTYMLSDFRSPETENSDYSISGNILFTDQDAIQWIFGDSAAVYDLKHLQNINHFIGSVISEYRPFSGFEARMTIGIDEFDRRTDRIQLFGRNYGRDGTAGRKDVINVNNRQITFSGDARYRYKVLGIDASSSIGFQLFDKKEKSSSVAKKGFPSGQINNIGAGETLLDANETLLHVREAGVFTEHAFSYAETYFGSFMVRKDYATVLGLTAPNIIYPRASLAVRFDRFGFIPSRVNLLKVRMAYGETGVLPGRLDGIPLLWDAVASAYGPGAELQTIGNPDIKPERIKEWEIGFETQLFNKYAIDFTYYRQSANNSIILFPNLPSTGKSASAVPRNVGKIKGWGVESQIQASLVRSRNFQLDVSLINNYATNEVVDLSGAPPPSGMQTIKVGLPKYEWYWFDILGPVYDADGRYAGFLQSEGKVDLGSSIPKYTGSLSVNFRFFKNLSLYALTEWKTNFFVYNNTQNNQHFFSKLGIGPLKRFRELEDMLGMRDWFDEIQALTPGSDEYKKAAEEFVNMDASFGTVGALHPGDFFRLRELSLSYNCRDLLPLVNMDKFIQNLTIGFSAQNLWITSKFKGMGRDPELSRGNFFGRSNQSFTLPHPTVYQFWMRVTF